MFLQNKSLENKETKEQLDEIAELLKMANITLYKPNGEVKGLLDVLTELWAMFDDVPPKLRGDILEKINEVTGN
jgi:hypothetical protein